MPEEKLNHESMKMLLQSFRWIRCAYTHYENPGHFFLASLRALMTTKSKRAKKPPPGSCSYIRPGTSNLTAEKQLPSPLQFLADFRQAISLERWQSKGATRPLKDILAKVSADYNRMCTVKRHRVCSSKKSLIYNMPLSFKGVGTGKSKPSQLGSCSWSVFPN